MIKHNYDHGKPTKLDACCFCLSLTVGVYIISTIQLVLTLILTTGLIAWIILSYEEEDCFGPVYFDTIKYDCEELIGYQMLENEQQFETFEKEIFKISSHFQDYKLGLIPTLTILGSVSLFSTICAITLIIGTRKANIGLLVPWLIFAKVSIILLIVGSVYIIFLEARLFGIGTSVFGLFCVVTICLSVVQGYFLFVVHSLRLEFQIESEKSQCGETNYGFIDEQPMSDPQVETIPMQTFSITPNQRDKNQQILDCSTLEALI